MFGNSGSSDRDRFLWFAFAGADVLIELDENQRITYSAGTVADIFGPPLAALSGQPFEMLIAVEDQERLREFYAAILREGRASDLIITTAIALGSAERTRIRISGIIAPSEPDKLYLTIKKLISSAPMANAQHSFEVFDFGGGLSAERAADAVAQWEAAAVYAEDNIALLPDDIVDRLDTILHDDAVQDPVSPVNDGRRAHAR